MPTPYVPTEKEEGVQHQQMGAVQKRPWFRFTLLLACIVSFHSPGLCNAVETEEYTQQVNPKCFAIAFHK